MFTVQAADWETLGKLRLAGVKICHWRVLSAPHSLYLQLLPQAPGLMQSEVTGGPAEGPQDGWATSCMPVLGPRGGGRRPIPVSIQGSRTAEALN